MKRTSKKKKPKKKKPKKSPSNPNKNGTIQTKNLRKMAKSKKKEKKEERALTKMLSRRTNCKKILIRAIKRADQTKTESNLTMLTNQSTVCLNHSSPQSAIN